MLRFSTCLTFALLAGVTIVSSWPSGAPEGACESLAPSHGNNVAKDKRDVPFTVTQSSNTYQPGEKVKGQSN